MLLNSSYGLDSVLVPENIKMNKVPPQSSTDANTVIKKERGRYIREMHRSSGTPKTGLHLINNECAICDTMNGRKTVLCLVK